MRKVTGVTGNESMAKWAITSAKRGAQDHGGERQ